MPQSDDAIANAYIRHGLALIRAANGLASDVDLELVKLVTDIRYLLARATLTEMGRRALNALISDVEDVIYQRYNTVLDEQTESLRELAEIESHFAKQESGLDRTLSGVAVLGSLLILGHSLKDWWRKQAQDLAFRIAADIRAAQRTSDADKAAAGAIFGGTGRPNGVVRPGTGGEIGNARRNARSLTQTAAWAAANDARFATFKANGVKFVEWHAILDAKVCPVCALHAGKLYTIDGEPVKHDVPIIPIPAHNWCLTGDTLVTPSGRITAVTERRYEGNLIVIRTASGNQLSCTPNHPVLTDRGWLPASALDVGLDVVCSRVTEYGAAASVENNSENVPTRIEDIARSFSEARGMRPVEVPTTREDFHGDGIDGDVAVVWSEHALRNGEQAAVDEHVRKLDLGVGSRAHLQHAGVGGPEGLNLGPRLTADGGMAWSGLSTPLLGSHGGSAKDVGLGRVPRLDPSLLEALVNSESSDSVTIGQCEHGFAIKVSLNDLRIRQITAVPPPDRSDAMELPVEGGVSDACLADHILRGHAGAVFLDRIVDKSEIQFAGHVYNLETTDHWYVANGIINHNCRCIFIPHSGEPPADGGQNLTKFDDWLATLTDEQENHLLGKGRAELYRRGVITLTDLLNQSGQLLTLAELRAML